VNAPFGSGRGADVLNAAQARAKAGYVGPTCDPHGRGQSDTLWAGSDLLEGVPAQTDGRPFSFLRAEVVAEAPVPHRVGV
jgi:hypothetical protein